MGHFTTRGKRYREADDLLSFGSTDSIIGAPGITVSQTAPGALPGPDGEERQFLYWDTGRRITNKRTVHWTFNHPANWTDWNAVAWYGHPVGGPPGQPIVSADAHWVGVSPIDPTPISPPPASVFVNGPGPTAAWPWTGNDHLVRTEWGAATLTAKGTLQRSPADPVIYFSSWTKLIYGGDPTGFFAETDDDITSSSPTLSGVENVTSPSIVAPIGSADVYLAGYVIPPRGPISIPDKLREILADPGIIKKFINVGDPSPEDIIRLKLISESLDLVRGVKPTDNDAFEGLVAAAKKMSTAELKRTVAATKSTLARGQAALKSIEALAAKHK